MAETISLEVKGRVSEKLLKRIYRTITPEYVKNLLIQNGMSTDDETVETVTTSYACGFPTADLALKALTTKRGMKFWGIASGYASRPERMAVKYLILENIQAKLEREGIRSELNISDLNSETIEYMDQRGIFKGKLPKLKRIAKKRGNLENLTMGVQAAILTPA